MYIYIYTVHDHVKTCLWYNDMMSITIIKIITIIIIIFCAFIYVQSTMTVTWTAHGLYYIIIVIFDPRVFITAARLPAYVTWIVTHSGCRRQ